MTFRAYSQVPTSGICQKEGNLGKPEMHKDTPAPLGAATAEVLPENRSPRSYKPGDQAAIFGHFWSNWEETHCLSQKNGIDSLEKSTSMIWPHPNFHPTNRSPRILVVNSYAPEDNDFQPVSTLTSLESLDLLQRSILVRLQNKTTRTSQKVVWLTFPQNGKNQVVVLFG